MKQLKSANIALLALCFCAPAAAQDQDPDTLIPEPLREQALQLQEAARERSRAFDIVASLTTRVGARFAGTRGDKAAVAWALLKLRELGFENVHAEPVTVPQWVRGEIGVSIVSPYPQPLVALALGGSVGTDADGITAPVMYVKNMDELRALEPGAARGKIVYIGERMERTRSGIGYGQAVDKRREGPAVAAAKGARAVLIRSTGTGNTRLAHTGSTSYRDDVKRIPAAALSNVDADMLERQLATGQRVVVHLRLGSRYLPDTQSANVIGEIRGADPVAGIILLAAHLDSWDVGTGAIDDGAGIAIVTEAARLIGALDGRPRRTIRVVLFANEEFGLSGAKEYAAAHADEIPQHVLAMEADFGDGAVWQIASNVPEEKRDVVAAMARLLEPLGVALGGNDAGGGADIGPLRRLGVPVLAPRQDGTEYFDVHHTMADTLDEVDPESLDQNVAVYATLAFIAANLEMDFGRLAVDENM